MELKKLKTLKDLKLDSSTQAILKRAAKEYVKVQTIPSTRQYNEIQMFFHCYHCLTKEKLKSNSFTRDEFVLEAGCTRSMSRIIIQCAACKRIVKAFDLSLVQTAWAKHFFNL